MGGEGRMRRNRPLRRRPPAAAAAAVGDDADSRGGPTASWADRGPAPFCTLCSYPAVRVPVPRAHQERQLAEIAKGRWHPRARGTHRTGLLSMSPYDAALAASGHGWPRPPVTPPRPTRAVEARPQRLLPTPKEVTGTTPPRASTLATAAAVLLEPPRLSPSPPPSTTKLHAQPTKHKTPVDHTTGQPVRAEVDQTRPPTKSIPNTTVRDRSSRRNNKTVSTRCEQGYRRRSGSSKTSRGAREPRARQRDAPTISLERYQHDSGPGTEPDTPSSAGNSLLYK